jgi:hypothetical protein
MTREECAKELLRRRQAGIAAIRHVDGYLVWLKVIKQGETEKDEERLTCRWC